MRFTIRDLFLVTMIVALFVSGTLVLGQQPNKVRNGGAKKSATQQYAEGVESFRFGVMGTGVAVLLGAAALLRRWRTDDREAMADLGRVLGLLFVVLGLGIIYYGYSFTGGLPSKSKDKAAPASKAVVPIAPKKAGPYLHPRP
jgi:hypothetical protein